MKFSLFSNKKDKEKKVDDTTDFLNPASPGTIADLEKPRKFKEKRGKKKKNSKSGKENKVLEKNKDDVKSLKEKKEKEEKERKEKERKEKEKKEKEELRKNFSNKKEKKQLDNISKDVESKQRRKEFIQKKKKVEDVSLENEAIADLMSQIEEADKEVKEYEERKVEEKNDKENEIKAENLKTKKDKKEVKNFNKKEVGLINKYLEGQKKKQKVGKSNSGKESNVFSKKKIQEVNVGIDREDLLDKANILEINLVKDQLSVYFAWYKNLAFLLVLIFLCFLFVVEIYLGLSWWQSYNQNSNNYKYEDFNLAELSVELRNIKEDTDEALAFQDNLNKVSYLLNNHVYWTNLFDYLEASTLEGVKYVQFSGDLSGNYSLDSIADNYPLIGRQTKKYLEDKKVSSAIVNAASLQEIKDKDNDVVDYFVTFTTELEIKPEVFKK